MNTFIITQMWVGGEEQGCFARFNAASYQEAKSIAEIKWGDLVEGVTEDYPGVFCATLSVNMADA